MIVPYIANTANNNIMFLKSITIKLLFFSSFSLGASAASPTYTCSRGGASIDGKRNKRFSLNRLRPQISSTSQLDRRRRDLDINNNLNQSTPNDSKIIGSGKSISTSSPRKSKKIKMYTTCISIVFAWLSLSTLFYAKFYDWPYPQVSQKVPVECLHSLGREEVRKWPVSELG